MCLQLQEFSCIRSSSIFVVFSVFYTVEVSNRSNVDRGDRGSWNLYLKIFIKFINYRIYVSFLDSMSIVVIEKLC